jgi:hypothetical protein
MKNSPFQSVTRSHGESITKIIGPPGSEQLSSYDGPPCAQRPASPDMTSGSEMDPNYNRTFKKESQGKCESFLLCNLSTLTPNNNNIGRKRIQKIGHLGVT